MVPTGNVKGGVCVFVHTRRAGAEQLSVAVGSVQLTTLLQVVAPGPVPTEMFVGHQLITGRTRSFTVTVKLHSLLMLLAASLAV